MNSASFRPDSDERAELAWLSPTPVERDLPSDRHRLLKEFVMSEIQQDPQPAKRARLRLLRPAFLAPVATAAATLAVALPALLGGGTPAYAVSKNPNGTINIEIREFKDPKKLQADLHDLGVNVIVDYLPPGKRCQGPRSTDLAPREQYRRSLLQFVENDRSSTGFSTRLDPSVIRTGQTAFIEYAKLEPNSVVDAAFNGWIASGPVAPCKLISGKPWPGGYPTR